ncbi:MAG: DUF1588 domain-containing protein [Deltaproteobacteria bacterium]|nr:DUF1588 domain-containing protein [Deltaproteobacteria bacterium]
MSTEAFFRDEVWAPILSTNCIQCHNPQGAAKDTDFVLQSAAQTGFLEANMRTIREVARFEVDGTSVLLLKPTGQIEHGGGQRIEPNGPEYQALVSLVAQLKEPIACAGTEGEDILAGVEYIEDVQVLRKVGLNLVSRLPTPSEEARVMQDGLPGVEAVLDQMMTEPAFYERLKEVYNDLLLTERYYQDTRAIDLLDGNDYPNRRWYNAEPDGTIRDKLAVMTNRAIAREPLELVAHVVREGRPFSEILTANYTLMSPFSARLYGVSGFAYFDGDDPDMYDPYELHEAQIPGVPHAGLLTTHVFLNRFPTTATNVNRHRSRMVYKMFLATDVLKLAERPVDPTQIQDHNPTLYNPACTVCHAVIDPMAGAFMNWDERGRYRPPEMGWNADMRPPGFGDATVPAGENTHALSWLAEQIADDDRFATAVVHTVFTALTGQEPVSGATDGLSPADAKARLQAFELQEEVFGAAKKRFVDSNQDFKAVVKAMAVSPYVRAANVDPVPAEREAALGWLGTGHLLTPEQLDRKIVAVTGYPWIRNNRNILLNEFRIFYGGIDSDTVTTRIDEPNGVMSNIAARMATEMSCLAVPKDFNIEDPAQRRLFPHVERSFQPEDDNGFEVAGAVAAIKDNIRHLHQRVLGEDPSNDELDATYQLFLETWREGKAAVAAGDLSVDVDYRCRSENDAAGEPLPEALRVRRDEAFTVRAWMAVMAYLLNDYGFLFE